MTSAQHLAIAAAAVGIAGQVGALFRKVVGWSIVLLLFVCALVYLQSTWSGWSSATCPAAAVARPSSAK